MPVADVARARNFYETSLGLTAGLVGNQGDNYWVEYDLPGGGCFALTNFIPDQSSAAAGGTIAFEVDDLDQLIADLKATGTIFQGDIVHGPHCRMSVCLDTEGNSILLHQLNAK